MFPASIFARFAISLAVFAACAGAGNRPVPIGAREAQSYGVIMAELALARRQFLVAARQYGELSSHTNETALLQRAAEVAGAVEQPGLALRAAQRWASAAPASVDAQHSAALAALELYQIERATMYCFDWVRIHPRGAEAAFAEIDAAFGESENVFGTRQVADALAAKFPDSPGALRMQGFAALRADDSGAAVKAFERAAGHGASPELNHALLRAQVLGGDVDAALARARAEGKDPSQRVAGFDYALLLLAAHHGQEARKVLTLAAERPETGMAALRLLGQLQLQSGDLDGATVTFTRLLSNGRLADDAFYYLGIITERRGHPKQALHLYARVAAGENMLPALVRAAEILHAGGSSKEADDLFDRLVLDAPERAPKIWAARARMYSQSHEPKRALATLDAAIEDYPDSVDLHYARATLYEDMNDVSAAIAELRMIEKSRPNDPAMWNALGYTLADHRLQLVAARQLIDKAYRAAPQNAAIQDSLGWVLYRQGLAAQALPHLNDAFANDGGAEVGAHLGEVLWTLGRHLDADKIWLDAERADPDDRVLKSTLARFRSKK